MSQPVFVFIKLRTSLHFFLYMCVCVFVKYLCGSAHDVHTCHRGACDLLQTDPRISTLTFNSPKGTRQENLHAYWPDGGGFLWGLFEWRGA